MYKKFVSTLYVMNIIAQSIITLVTPAALMFLLAWLLVEKCSLPSWVYVPFIALGFLAGFVSMIRFAISASEGLNRLEREQRKSTKNKGQYGKK